jgi:hypothetical protein
VIAPTRRSRLTRTAVTALTVALLAAGCFGDDPEDPVVPPVVDRGYVVEPSVGANRPVAAKLGPAGGTLTATAGPLTYTLTIPRDALLVETTIAMTPIDSIGKYPFATPFAGAVHLEPDGLVLSAPAELTITGGTPAVGATAFQFDGDGSGFHVRQLTPADSVRLSLLHFSGAGYGKSTAAERTSIPPPPGSVDRAFYEAARLDVSIDSPEIQARGAAWLTGATNAMNAAMTKLETAEKSETGEGGAEAAAEALAVDKLLNIAGEIDEARSKKIADLIDKLLKKAQTAAEKACTENTGDPAAAARLMLTLERQSQLLGLGGSATVGTSFQKCLDAAFIVKIKLDFEYDRNWKNTSTGWANYTFTASGEGPFTSTGTDVYRFWDATIPLAINPFTTTDPKCSGVTPGSRPPKLHVTALPNINPMRVRPNTIPADLLVNISPEGGLLIQCPQAMNFTVNLIEGAGAVITQMRPVPLKGGTVTFAGAMEVPDLMKWKLAGELTLTRVTAKPS